MRTRGTFLPLILPSVEQAQLLPGQRQSPPPPCSGLAVPCTSARRAQGPVTSGAGCGSRKGRGRGRAPPKRGRELGGERSQEEGAASGDWRRGWECGASARRPGSRPQRSLPGAKPAPGAFKAGIPARSRRGRRPDGEEGGPSLGEP